MRRISSHWSHVLLLALAIATTSTGWLQAWDTAEDRVRDFIRRPHRLPAADADDLTKLLIERHAAASVEVNLLCCTLGEEIPLNDLRLGEAVKRVVDAELELAANWETRHALLEGHLEFLKEAERVTRERYCNQGVPGVMLCDVARARFYRLDGEIRLLKAKRERNTTRRP